MTTNKINLYNQAKDAYYSGNPIMEDFEFDALEKELGLENKSYVGTRHNPSYTIKHPFIMGSIAKVQIHEKNDVIDWSTYYNEACNYFFKYHNDAAVIITPKYDGCSFEAFVENEEIKSISTRGDGKYGKDISAHLITKVKRNLLGKQAEGYPYTLRGEVLIDKTIFAEKYSEFVNPRSFVAGILNREYDPYDAEFLSIVNDLSIVIYDIRVNVPGMWFDYDWDNFNYPDRPTFYYTYPNIDKDQFEGVYNKFTEYRNKCPFALDGIVIKPTQLYRAASVDRRPKDCVAIKFIPMLQETEIVDIQWKVGKTGEYAPVVITKPVIMDGKTINRASGHNYGYLLDNNISIGTKVILSLAGDIIPFIYKITDTTKFDNNNMNVPDNTYIEGCHLMAKLDETEIAHLRFKNSAATLNIPNLGPAETENIWNYIRQDNGETDEFFADDMFEYYGSMLTKTLPNNILLISPEDIYFGVTSATKNGATGKAKKIKKAFEDVVRNITLKEIVKSCNFTACGDKVAEQCANYLIGNSYDFTHLAAKGYEWCLNENNKVETGFTENLGDVLNILNILGKTFEDFKNEQTETSANSNKIPVILTGEPNNYKTKGEFISCHPEYYVTTKWSEVKIVFTNDISSNTGKMKKAREKNIEIRTY